VLVKSSLYNEAYLNKEKFDVFYTTGLSHVKVLASVFISYTFFSNHHQVNIIKYSDQLHKHFKINLVQLLRFQI
jgi:uncharacterized membrane protein YukC